MSSAVPVSQMSSAVKAQHAKARQDLLAACASFMQQTSKHAATPSAPAPSANSSAAVATTTTSSATPNAPKADASGDKKTQANPLIKATPTTTPTPAPTPVAVASVTSSSSSSGEEAGKNN